MKQDKHQRAKERWRDATDAMREQHARMLEDMRFSNPSDPRQWDERAMQLRKGRPCLTFDRTNQFIAQVVNDGRQNKPAIHCLPADSYADVEVAERLNGIVRHIEYVSRAGIAYDTALEHAARVGLGWIRVVPEVIRAETNEQEIRIKRVHDPMSVKLDPNSTEPDGSDAMFGFVETTLTKREFQRLYPKAQTNSWDTEGGWFGEDSVRICEEFYVEEEEENRIVVDMAGQRMTVTEDEYWEIAQKTGVKPPFIENTVVTKRSIGWCKFSGAETLEETVFPSRFLPLIPVMGYELFIEGKRYLCGMTRRMMDSQRFHNFAVSAAYEAMATQPKAPFLLDERSVDGHEGDWNKLNTGNPAWLPYNGLDESGNQLPAPQRLAPPQIGTGITALIQYSGEAMESSLGMFKANLGQSGNETSGRAIMARQREGDTANFHYLDNLNRSIEQLGRVVVDMIPRIYDTNRQARIIGEDGAQDFIQINPDLPVAARKEDRKVVEINPSVGAYDVRVKSGPSYTTLRQQTAESLQEVISRNPQALALVGDIWVKMQDWPEADKVARRFQAMLPPNIQALEEEGAEDIPPELIAQMQAMQEQLAQQQQMLQQAGMEVQQAKQEAAQAKFAAQKAALERQAALLRVDEQEAIGKIKDAISQAQTQEQPEIVVPPELEQKVKEIKDGLTQLEAEAREIEHQRELLKKDQQIAVLTLQKHEQGINNTIQQAQQAQQAQDKAAEEKPEPEEPTEEAVEFEYGKDGALVSAKLGDKTFTIVRNKGEMALK